MADKLFPMYCPEGYIDGMLYEKAICELMLMKTTTRERAIALININGQREWIYGQCNFKHEVGHNFKFSNTFENLKTQGVLPALINRNGVDRLFFDDQTLMSTLSTDPATRRYAKMCVLLTREAGGYSRPVVPVERSGLGRMMGRLFGGPQA